MIAVRPGGSRPIAVLVVDDSAVMRGLWSKILDREKEIVVAATASNGVSALEKLGEHPIDVVVLDVEMPEMDGLTAIPLMLKRNPRLKIIMASSSTRQGSTAAMRALTLGAADFVTKSSALSPAATAAEVGVELVMKIKALAGTPVVAPPAPPAPRLAADDFRPKLIVIGASTGGPNALAQVLGSLDDEVDAPILIVQHMPPVFTTILAERIAKECRRPCHEAKNGQIVKPGEIFLAPGNFHMSIVAGEGGPRIALDGESPQENFCRPAVDPLFRSAARLYGRDLLGIVLTGMGEDGRRGVEEIVAAGGVVVAQDERSSVVWGMPGAVVSRGLAHFVLPVDEISRQVSRMCRKRTGRSP